MKIISLYIFYCKIICCEKTSICTLVNIHMYSCIRIYFSTVYCKCESVIYKYIYLLTMARSLCNIFFMLYVLPYLWSLIIFYFTYFNFFNVYMVYSIFWNRKYKRIIADYICKKFQDCVWCLHKHIKYFLYDVHSNLF